MLYSRGFRTEKPMGTRHAPARQERDRYVRSTYDPTIAKLQRDELARIDEGRGHRDALTMSLS